jgi:hypothetical protein
MALYNSMNVESEVFDFPYSIAASFSFWMRPTISFLSLPLSHPSLLCSKDPSFCLSLMSYDKEERVFCREGTDGASGVGCLVVDYSMSSSYSGCECSTSKWWI